MTKRENQGTNHEIDVDSQTSHRRLSLRESVYLDLEFGCAKSQVINTTPQRTKKRNRTYLEEFLGVERRFERPRNRSE